MNLSELTHQFAIQNSNCYLRFSEGPGGIPVIDIQNPFGSAKVSLQGAQVLSWIPKGGEDLIWLSDDAVFASGRSVRGGVPVCWPWFGKYEGKDSDKLDFPAHGFARTVMWQVVKTEALDDGATRITFTIEPSPEQAEMWPKDTSIHLHISFGEKLEIDLVTHNRGDTAITISQALHTYFNVGDVSKVRLHGLDGSSYLDKLEDFKRKVQHGPVNIEAEVDRIYLDTISDCVIEDPVMKRKIIIIKCGSHSTVVWNPWRETAASMGDLGDDGYKKMLCVESANAAEDVISIEPGKDHHLWVQYEVQGDV